MKTKMERRARGWTHLPKDPLKWLDDGLPDLSGYNNREFDLAMQRDTTVNALALAEEEWGKW
jgi:hypothetical protein